MITRGKSRLFNGTRRLSSILVSETRSSESYIYTYVAIYSIYSYTTVPLYAAIPTKDSYSGRPPKKQSISSIVTRRLTADSNDHVSRMDTTIRFESHPSKHRRIITLHPRLSPAEKSALRLLCKVVSD